MVPSDKRRLSRLRIQRRTFVLRGFVDFSSGQSGVQAAIVNLTSPFLVQGTLGRVVLFWVRIVSIQVLWVSFLEN